MAIRGLWAMLAGAVVMALALPAYPAHAAAVDTAAPTVAGVSFSPDSLGVSGLNLTPVTVSVHLTDADGVLQGTDMGGTSTPFIELEQVGSNPLRHEGVELHLVSGTAEDGVWGATIQVPSTWDGDWQVSRVIADDGAGNRLDADPRTSSIVATLQVVGGHQPAITFAFTPDPVIGDATFTFSGQLTDSETHAPLAGVGIFIGADTGCVEGGNAVPNAATDANGRYSKSVPPGQTGFLRCVGVPRPSNIAISPAFIVGNGGHPRVKSVIRAVPDRTSVPVGGKVIIRGNKSPKAGGDRIALQERVGTTWQTVDTSPVSDAGFTLDVTPTAEGTHTYRVFFERRDDPSLSGVSDPIVIDVGEGLANTGLTVLPYVGSGLALLLVGAGLVLLARRRRAVRL